MKFKAPLFISLKHKNTDEKLFVSLQKWASKQTNTSINKVNFTKLMYEMFSQRWLQQLKTVNCLSSLCKTDLKF